jgi:hypothetical protein
VLGVAGYLERTCTDSVNSMAEQLTAQVRNIADVGHGHRRMATLEEDHRRCERRNSAAQADDEHDGRTSERVLPAR